MNLWTQTLKVLERQLRREIFQFIPPGEMVWPGNKTNIDWDNEMIKYRIKYNTLLLNVLYLLMCVITVS